MTVTLKNTMFGIGAAVVTFFAAQAAHADCPCDDSGAQTISAGGNGGNGDNGNNGGNGGNGGNSGTGIGKATATSTGTGIGTGGTGVGQGGNVTDDAKTTVSPTTTSESSQKIIVGGDNYSERNPVNTVEAGNIPEAFVDRYCIKSVTVRLPGLTGVVAGATLGGFAKAGTDQECLKKYESYLAEQNAEAQKHDLAMGKLAQQTVLGEAIINNGYNVITYCKLGVAVAYAAFGDSMAEIAGNEESKRAMARGLMQNCDGPVISQIHPVIAHIKRHRVAKEKAEHVGGCWVIAAPNACLTPESAADLRRNGVKVIWMPHNTPKNG